MLFDLPLPLMLKILQQMDTVSFVRIFQTCKLIINSINLSPKKWRKHTSAEFYVNGTLLSLAYGGRSFNLSSLLYHLNSYRLDMFYFRRIHITTENSKYTDELSYLMKMLKVARVVCHEVHLATPMCKEEILQFKAISLEVDGCWDGFNNQYFRFFMGNILPGVEKMTIKSSRIIETLPLMEFFRYVEKSRQCPQTKEIMIYLRDLNIDISKFLTKVGGTYYKCVNLDYGQMGIAIIPTVKQSMIAMTYDIENNMMRLTYRVVADWDEFKQFYHRSYWFHKSIVNGPDLRLDDNPRFGDVKQLFDDLN